MANTVFFFIFLFFFLPFLGGGVFFSSPLLTVFLNETLHMVCGIIVKGSLSYASYLLRVYLLTTYEQETLVYAELFAYNNCPLHV